MWFPPPNKQSIRLHPHANDYGHAFYYENFFCQKSQDIETILELCRTEQAPILDLAGGGGRVAYALAKAGHRVTLVDNSYHMLRLAYHKRAQLPFPLKARFQIENQDLNHLKLPSKFGSIFSIKNGLEHLPCESSLISALRLLKAHCKPGGKLYVEAHNLPYWKKQTSWKKAHWQFEGRFQKNFSPYWVWGRTLPGKNGEQVRWQHAMSRNRFTYTLLDTTIQILSQRTWKACFQVAGFQWIDCWGGWQEDALSDQSPNVVYLARVLG